ncbi:MAG: hypothetical protein ACRYGF_09015 [Janthinobacterium lividum]
MPEMIGPSPEEFSRQLAQLEILAREASTEAGFLRVTEQAKAAGMTYKEALESVIREANGGAD